MAFNKAGIFRQRAWALWEVSSGLDSQGRHRYLLVKKRLVKAFCENFL